MEKVKTNLQLFMAEKIFEKNGPRALAQGPNSERNLYAPPKSSVPSNRGMRKLWLPANFLNDIIFKLG